MTGHLALRRIAVILGAICLFLFAWYVAVRPSTLAVAIGPAGTSQVTFVEGIARVLKETRQRYRFRLVAVEGTAEASRLLDAGKVDLAVVRSDDLTSKDARSVAILHKRAIILVARKKRGIETLRDIAKKRFAIVNVDRDSYRPIVERILAHYEIATANLDLREMNRQEAAKAMAENRIDGFILVVNPASRPVRSMVSELIGKQKVDVIIKGVPAHEALALRLRELQTISIPEGVFGGSPLRPDDDEDSVAITLELVASSRLSEQGATALTKALLEVRTRLRAGQENTYTIEAPPVDETRRFLPHAGTAAFVNSESKTLLEEYSDQIWLGIFLLGLIGSSVAGVMSWAGLKAEAPSETLDEQMRLLAERLAHADTIAEIDSVQGDFDGMMLGLMREYGLRALAEPGTPDSSPWLQTFNGLIARRRALLMDMPTATPASHSGNGTIQ